MEQGKTTAPKPETRAPYEPPCLRRIDLLAEEVLSTGCKITTEAYPMGECLTCGITGS